MSMLFKRIKDWATSITAFRTGDVIPVDGPSGTAKMSKDDLLKNMISTGGSVNSNNADTIFGVDRKFENSVANTMYNVPATLTINDRPLQVNGVLLTINGNNVGDVRIQYFFATNGSNRIFYRCKWGSVADVYSNWKELTYDANLVRSIGSINTSEAAVSAFGAGKDVGEAQHDSIYTISTATGCTGLPTGYTQGTLLTFTGNVSGGSKVQIFIKNESGEFFVRAKWGNVGATFSDWVCITEDKKAIHSVKLVNSSAIAEAEFGASKDVSNARYNTIYSIDSADVVGVPYKQGLLLTYSGSLTGAAGVQIYITHRPDNITDFYYRLKWSGTWDGWHKVNANAPDVIQTFEKIGVAGGSIPSGESVYKDSDSAAHYIDFYENSFVQLWAKKHGISGCNFSKGGLSTKYWLESSVGLTKAQEVGNKCKVYFTLFGGGNDERDWDGLNGLGTIADVHVGNEELNAESFYGNFSKIIAALQGIGGQHTKVICFTYPNNFGAVYGSMGLTTYLQYRQAVMDVVALYSNCYCIDLYGDYVLENLGSPYKYVGHFSAVGYKIIADRIEQRVNEYVAQHPDDFQDVQWIGTNYDIAEWYAPT